MPLPRSPRPDALRGTMALVCVRVQGTAYPGQHTRADHPRRQTALDKGPFHGSERVRTGVKLAGPRSWVKKCQKLPGSAEALAP